jgi:hypothetical protein
MIIRLLLVVGLIGSMLLLMAFGLYVRDILRWRGILRKALAGSAREHLPSTDPRFRAEAFLSLRGRALLMGRVSVTDFPGELTDAVRHIAALFHPGHLRPHLQVTPAHILACVNDSINQLDVIRSRPGFSILASVSLGELDRLRRCYLALVGGVSEPFTLSMLMDLVKQIRLLMFARYLAVELFLFMGHLAVDIYSDPSTYRLDEKKIDLEQALRDLSRIRDRSENTLSPQVMRIRTRLVGATAVMVKDPDLIAWKQAVGEAAALIAAERFPRSDRPMLEARIGPLVSCFQEFLDNLGKGDGYRMAGKLFNIRLDTLFQAQRVTEALMPPQIRRMVMQTRKTYGWLKWPLNLYMLAGKGVFWKIAVDLGWFAGRKALLVLLFGRTFDKAVYELDRVYRLSKGPV